MTRAPKHPCVVFERKAPNPALKLKHGPRTVEELTISLRAATEASRTLKKLVKLKDEPGAFEVFAPMIGGCLGLLEDEARTAAESKEKLQRAGANARRGSSQAHKIVQPTEIWTNPRASVLLLSRRDFRSLSDTSAEF